MLISEEEYDYETLLITPIQKRILDILDGKVLRRSQICKELGYEFDNNIGYNGLYKRRTTVYDNLLKLKNKGLVNKTRSKGNGRKGRPPELWKINYK